MKIFTDICNRVVHSCRKAERQKPQLAGRAAAISEEAVTDAAQIVGKRRWPWIGVILDNIAKSGRNPTRVAAGYLAAWILFFLVLSATLRRVGYVFTAPSMVMSKSAFP